jgi:hypothetical protein
MNIYLSSAYLAPVEYYSILYNCSNVLIEQHENYTKQTYRNRCTILSANGRMPLSVPVESTGGKRCPIRDVRIAEHGNWRHLHWNALVSAYNSTPFFEYYRDDFEPFYQKKYTYLFDFNEELRALICNLLDMGGNTAGYTSGYYAQGNGEDWDLRESLCPKKDWRQNNHCFRAVPYYQVFGERFGFTENLSIVDLLFNMGNESPLVLKACYTPG